MWLLEIRAGIYVGDYGRRVRERIWEDVSAMLEDGDAVMVWSAPTDQGFKFLTEGLNRRMPVDFDGLNLVQFAPPKEPFSNPNSGKSTGTMENSKKSKYHQ